MTKFVDELNRLGACGEAMEWVGNRSFQQAWDECPRSDWMLWLDEQWNILTDGERRLLAADFAEAVLPIYAKYYPGDLRPCLAVKATRDFAEGRIDRSELTAARAAAREAAREAAGSAAWAAAWTAAKGAAGSAAWAAAGAAAREAAWAAAGAAAREAAWAAARQRQADMIRVIHPTVTTNKEDFDEARQV